MSSGETIVALSRLMPLSALIFSFGLIVAFVVRIYGITKNQFYLAWAEAYIMWCFRNIIAYGGLIFSFTIGLAALASAEYQTEIAAQGSLIAVASIGFCSFIILADRIWRDFVR